MVRCEDVCRRELAMTSRDVAEPVASRRNAQSPKDLEGKVTRCGNNAKTRRGLTRGQERRKIAKGRTQRLSIRKKKSASRDASRKEVRSLGESGDLLFRSKVHEYLSKSCDAHETG